MPFLDWVNKNQALGQADEIPYHLLQNEASYGEDSDNLLIQGDNLLALKALRPLYEGQIKCVFIDPPYNTKSAFSHYDDKLEHSQWLSMMYPRIQLIRDLLSDDGSLWITLDDNESHYLKILCDEIFGRQNFVSNIVWEKTDSPRADAKLFSSRHDHLFLYAKDISKLSLNREDATDDAEKRFKLLNHDGRKYYLKPLIKSGGESNRDDRPTMHYELTAPDGTLVYPIKGDGTDGRWRWMRETYDQRQDDIVWKESGGKWSPQVKTFFDGKNSLRVPESIWFKDDVGTNTEAKNEIKKMNSEDVFDTPKPERLLKRIIHMATNEGDFVLDSFLGSGTTVAVAHKMNRKWIGIEMGDHAKTHCVPRLKKVIEGEHGGISESVNWQGGGGFHFCKLAGSMFDEFGQVNGNVKFKTLAHFLWNFETKTPAPKEYETPLLGVHNGIAYYLLYNGILGDRRPDGGNVLTTTVLKKIKFLIEHDGPKVIYGEACRLGQNRLDSEQITFKQIPYDISAI